jgi:tryptophan 7-halogenase
MSTTDDRIQSILIVGRDAAAWLAAAMLARRLSPASCAITVLEYPRPEPDPFSVSTLPSFHRLNAVLELDEAGLMRRTRATFKLGCEFRDWYRVGDRYFHAFGSLGAKLEAVTFHHHWLRLREAGLEPGVEDYSVSAVAARCQRFAHPSADPRSVLSLLSYGHHFDAAHLAMHLRENAIGRGVTALCGSADDVAIRNSGGFIEGIHRGDGERLRADLYIDCDAPWGVLSRGAEMAHVDWSRWLPCDRAIAVRVAGTDEPLPCSRATAGPAGWLWHTPLQGFVDAGYAYSSRHCTDDDARSVLMSQLPSPPAESRAYRLRAGRPAKFWNGNCLTLAGSALDPLESTSLHLSQTGIARFLSLFPVQRLSPPDIDEYNRQTALEYDGIRDLLVLHYIASARTEPFWAECRQVELPETLRTRLELFRQSGRLARFDEEHFSEDSWLSVLLGQHVVPATHDPLADLIDLPNVQSAFGKMRGAIRDAVETLPRHTDYLRTMCAASLEGPG